MSSTDYPAPNPLPRLVALDMDGTLLDETSEVPEAFWPLLARAHDAGMTLAPASGRQLATLRNMFEERAGFPMTFIAENGTAVYHHGRIIDTTAIPREDVLRALDVSATISTPHEVVICLPEVAYVRRGIKESTRAEMLKYYVSVEYVDDIRAVAADSDVIKLAFYCPSGTEAHIYPPLADAAGDLNLAVSGEVWLDIMAQGADKGQALKHMAAKLDIPIAETAAFGDFLNDYELLDAAGTAVAMDNAHQKLKDIADVIAPSNVDGGVMTVLNAWLDQANRTNQTQKR